MQWSICFFLERGFWRTIKVVCGIGFVAIGVNHATAQSPSITPAMSIDQDKLMEDKYTFREVVESGRHLFVNPFTTDEGYGEGPDGPRRRYQQVGTSPDIPWIRMNGLDAQSCLECHNQIGSDPLYDSRTEALGRKFGVVGGSAGLSANVFGNPDFPNSITQIVRNPPHVFGTGYIQQLTEEMTLELLAQRESGLRAAQSSPGTTIEVDLRSKGTDFGSMTLRYEGASEAVVEDFSGLEGVSEDLVVRGLQFKGIASNERNFVRDALNFHFSMQPEELFYESDDKGYVVVKPDEDGDGFVNEVSPGNVSALSVFSVSIRPPSVEIPKGMEETFNRGYALFTGEAGDVNAHGRQSCASCHTPSLRVEDTLATVLDPRAPENSAKVVVKNFAGLSNSVDSSSDLPIVKRFKRASSELSESEKSNSDLTEAILGKDKELKRREDSPLGPGFRFDLTDLPNSLPLSYPRLPENPDGSVDVPLFSDLKRHDMGVGLADPVDQQTDAEGIFVPAREFLTRPLWGVGDTGPWLHDARAITLREAILYHRSEGSEANEAVDRFESFSKEDQDALIAFLTCLRLPEEGPLEQVKLNPNSPGDFNGDGKVNALDQMLLMSAWKK